MIYRGYVVVGHYKKSGKQKDARIRGGNDWWWCMGVQFVGLYLRNRAHGVEDTTGFAQRELFRRAGLYK